MVFLLCCIMSNMAFGHDFEAVNDDGVTIYYNIISSTDKMVEVTYMRNRR